MVIVMEVHSYPYIYISIVEYLVHDQRTDVTFAYLRVKHLLRIEIYKAVFMCHSLVSILIGQELYRANTAAEWSSSVNSFFNILPVTTQLSQSTELPGNNIALR